jgi:energy-coupling factor transport system ATP-binding protein
MSIRLTNLEFGYSEETPVLHGINLDVAEGEFVLLVGPNGTGKSTLLKLLNGILKPGSGTVSIDGLDTRTTAIPELAAHIAVTFQNPSDQIFAATIREEILFGPKTLRRSNPEQLADESMELFQLSTYALKHPYDLSSAHRKLLTIASAAATDAPILAFDEPTASLSQPERSILLRAMYELKRRKRTLLIVSHDLDFFVPEATMLVVLNEGSIRHVGKPYDIVNSPRVARSAGMNIPLPLRIQRIAAAGTSGEIERN